MILLQLFRNPARDMHDTQTNERVFPSKVPLDLKTALEVGFKDLRGQSLKKKKINKNKE